MVHTATKFWAHPPGVSYEGEDYLRMTARFKSQCTDCGLEGWAEIDTNALRKDPSILHRMFGNGPERYCLACLEIQRDAARA